jgi:hypothetical protein
MVVIVRPYDQIIIEKDNCKIELVIGKILNENCVKMEIKGFEGEIKVFRKRLFRRWLLQARKKIN